MTDRELLILAARAAGIELLCRDSERSSMKVKKGHPTRWNPLANDGDAFRLAVSLEFRVDILHDASQPKPWLRIIDRDGYFTHAMVKEFEANPCAATRYAIVCAAAEVGKRMP